MHLKAYVVDHSWLRTGSANWSPPERGPYAGTAIVRGGTSRTTTCSSRKIPGKSGNSKKHSTGSSPAGGRTTPTVPGAPLPVVVPEGGTDRSAFIAPEARPNVGLSRKHATIRMKEHIFFCPRESAQMARVKNRLPSNVPGNFYVDSSCIDCGACEWLAPETFEDDGGKARVFRQPFSAQERIRALGAVTACPVAAIGTIAKQDFGEALDLFPEGVDGPVSYCGYHSPRSFGAASYLIRRPEGNILVDSPRFAAPLSRGSKPWEEFHSWFSPTKTTSPTIKNSTATSGVDGSFTKRI